MALVVHRDRIKDSSLRKTLDGVELVRSFYVSGIPAGSTPASHILLAALAASGMPVYGDAHPDNVAYGLNLRAQDFDVAPSGGGDSAWVAVKYIHRNLAVSGGILRNYQVVLTTEQTDSDINGNPIQVTYFVHNAAAGAPIPDGSKERKSGATVEAMRPLNKILARKSIPSGFSVATYIRPYIGRTNAGTWITEGITEGFALCVGANARTENGISYDLEYEFWENERGWAKYVAYILPETGRRPYNAYNGFVGVGVNNGFARVIVHGSADFNLLY